MDFRILKKAEITQGEFARLLGVHRVTVNKWVQGKIKPHRLIEARVAEVLTLLQEAVKRHHLPYFTRSGSRAAYLQQYARLGYAN